MYRMIVMSLSFSDNFSFVDMFYLVCFESLICDQGARCLFAPKGTSYSVHFRALRVIMTHQ